MKLLWCCNFVCCDKYVKAGWFSHLPPPCIINTKVMNVIKKQGLIYCFHRLNLC